MLIVASLFCNGWYQITRGYYYVLPDGSTKPEGEIFGFWERFWEKQTGISKHEFSPEAHESKLFELRYLDKKLGDKFVFQYVQWALIKEVAFSEEEQIKVEKLLSCKMMPQYHPAPNCISYRLYYETPKYRFPSWIRKPISGCVICMASVYGTIIYYSFGFLTKFSIFIIFEYEKAAIVCFWFIFMTCLSYLNFWFSKVKKSK